MGEKWIIYWNEHSSDTYLYGSDITFHGKDDVEYKNPLMPSGTIIKQWYSKTNFQAQMIEPALPLIDGEGAYEITLDAEYPDDEHCLLRVVFYDRYDEETGYVIIKNHTGEFQCPLNTYSYRVQLINGGLTEFHFHSFTIQEVIDEAEEAD